MQINHFEYSRGNRKIGTDTIIFNMGSAKNCPSKKLGLCDIPTCYAEVSEKMYPGCIPYRDRQEAYWLNTTADEIAIDLCGAIYKHRKTVKFVRINEAGDLHSANCLTKLIQIAKIVKEQFPSIVLYTYTHRSDLITDKTFNRLIKNKIEKNLIINCSNFERKGLNTFKAIEGLKVHRMKDIAKLKSEILQFTNYACMGDCSICGYCKKPHGKIIGVPIH